jgi:hypothetical protein
MAYSPLRVQKSPSLRRFRERFGMEGRSVFAQFKAR